MSVRSTPTHSSFPASYQTALWTPVYIHRFMRPPGLIWEDVVWWQLDKAQRNNISGVFNYKSDVCITTPPQRLGANSRSRRWENCKSETSKRMVANQCSSASGTVQGQWIHKPTSVMAACTRPAQGQANQTVAGDRVAHELQAQLKTYWQLAFGRKSHFSKRLWPLVSWPHSSR